MTDQVGSKDFGEWLIGQQRRKDAVGELARYAKRLKGFHRDMMYHEFRKLLRGSQVSEDTINQAIYEYMVYREDRKRRWKNMFQIKWRRRRKSRRS